MKYIYWDSNCFPAYLKGEEHGRDAILGVLQAVERGEAKLVTSAFTMVEVVKVKAKNANGPYYITDLDRRIWRSVSVRRTASYLSTSIV